MNNPFDHRLLAAIALMGTWLAGASLGAGESTNRIWRARNGDTVEATFEKLATGYVHLRKPDASKLMIPLSNLSDEDRRVVAELAAVGGRGAAGGAAAAPAVELNPAIRDLFGKELRNARKKKVAVETLAGKYVGIYFSAHWCPPCRAFTPELVKFHKALTGQAKPFEIVFVSSDRSSDDMYGYMQEMGMPWLALPHGSKVGDALKQKFNVTGIPKLVVVGPAGETISTEARGEVGGRGEAAFEAWQKAQAKK